MLPVDVSGSQLLFGIMLHMIYETTHIGHIDHAQYLQMTICKQLHGDLMPGWLTWCVSRFFFLMGFNHQRYKLHRFFWLDPPSTVHIFAYENMHMSTHVRIFIDVINKHILYIKHTWSIHLYLYIPHKSTWCFCFNSRPGVRPWSVFCGEDILLDLQGCRTITDTGIKRRASHNFTYVKLPSFLTSFFWGETGFKLLVVSSWWFEKHFLCLTPTWGWWSNLTSIFFQMGWFNHQPAI